MKTDDLIKNLEALTNELKKKSLKPEDRMIQLLEEIRDTVRNHYPYAPYHVCPPCTRPHQTVWLGSHYLSPVTYTTSGGNVLFNGQLDCSGQWTITGGNDGEDNS